MIEIRQHTGYRRGKLTDTGLDAVWVIDPLSPTGRRIGFAARHKGAPLQLTENGVAATLIAEAKRALAARDGGYDKREVTEPPQAIEGDDDEYDD